jgi:hypothetical protein
MLCKSKKALHSKSLRRPATTNRTPFGAAATASKGGDIYVNRRRRVKGDRKVVSNGGYDATPRSQHVSRGTLVDSK